MRSLMGSVDVMPKNVSLVLWQLFGSGPTWDGNLACKPSRQWLVESGLAERAHGFNFLTLSGVELAISLGMGRAKESNKSFDEWFAALPK